MYDLPTRAIAPAPGIDPAALPPCDPAGALPRLLADPTLASKRWIYRQYDHQVGGGTVLTPGSDAAVFWLRDADKFLAVTADCNALYCRLDPREGARIAVAEAARNLACSGAHPLALTDNLNFGNPHNPENLWCLVEAVEGMAEACRTFGTPVTGGNVSLYNQSPESAIDPTPTVAMVGLIERREEITAQGFRQEGDAIVLLGGTGSELGASHYLKICHGRKEGRPPRLDFERELALHRLVLNLIRRGIVRSAHDCSEGGLAVALAESCMTGAPPTGAAIDLGEQGCRPDVALFNETQSRVILSLPPQSLEDALALAHTAGVEARPIGRVGGDRLEIRVGQTSFAWDLSALRDAWENAIPECMAEG